MKVGNVEVYGVIYKITNKINNKIYIGRTVNGFDKRYKNNLEKYTVNAPLKNSIKKYGIENFEIIKIFDIAFSNEELNLKEEMYIELYKSNKKRFGYNLTKGGSFKNDEYRINMSKSLSQSEIHKLACNKKSFRDNQSQRMKKNFQDVNFRNKHKQAVLNSWTEIRRKEQSIRSKKINTEEVKSKKSDNMTRLWKDKKFRDQATKSMKKVYIMENIHTKEKIEFLGREELAKYVGKSVSYIKTRLNKNITHLDTFIFYNK